MERITLVAVDLDGTLLTSEGDLAPRSARMLRLVAEAGVRVVLATARNPYFVRPLSRELGLSDPIICTNGAQVWGSPTGPVWDHHTMPTGAALAIAQHADESNWELSITVGSTTYLRQRPGQMLGLMGPNVTIVSSNSEAIVGPPVRILTHQIEAIEGIRVLCGSTHADQCRVETSFNPDGSAHSLGVCPPGVDKGTGLAVVLGRIALPEHEVMAIGDNTGDLPMFRHARIRVAVANATDALKDRATVVAPSNDHEGVAWALRKYGVGQGQGEGQHGLPRAHRHR